MGRLATWTGRRVLVLWLAWFGLLGLMVLLNVRRQWRSQVSAVPSAESTGAATGNGNHLKAPPEQHTDFVYSVVLDRMAVLKAVLALLGPPGFLTAVWLYARSRRHPGRPT